MKRLATFVTVLMFLLAALPAVYGQSVTGQISGIVVDPAGAVIPGAAVQLTHDLSQTVRKFTTESNGSFVFTGLVPGNYSLQCHAAGLQDYDQKNIVVAAQERVDLHEIHLSVGEVTSTVEVQANAVHVATDSSDRSISISLQQIQDTPTRGRNPVSLIMTLPGVQIDRVERLSRLERRRHPRRQRRTAGPDHPQHGRRRQPGLRQPQPRLHQPFDRRDRRSQTAGLQLHGGVRRAHRRAVDGDAPRTARTLSTAARTTTTATRA